MKTKKEWAEYFKHSPTLEEFITAIQADAVKHGMTLAAEIVARNWNGQPSNYCDLIEAVRDNLQLP